MLLMFFATVANASPSVLQDRKCKILLYKVMCVLWQSDLRGLVAFFLFFSFTFFYFSWQFSIIFRNFVPL